MNNFEEAIMSLAKNNTIIFQRFDFDISIFGGLSLIERKTKTNQTNKTKNKCKVFY